MSSFKKKSFHGIIWSFIDNFAGSGITFIVGIVLARLLEPSVFGIIGMVGIFLAISNTFIDSGFSVGLIRKIKCSDDEYSTVLIFNFVISLFFYLLIIIFAPLISKFFNEPELIKILRILGIVIIIDSLAIVHRVILIREINFKSQTKISLSASIISGIVGISMAFHDYGIWSLVFQIITRQLLIGLLLWISSKWRPQIRFSIGTFKELFAFGSKLLVTNIITTLQKNIFYFIIGRYFSATSLGYYTRAEQFNSIVISNINGPIERVFFPVLSSIQQDEVRLKETLKRVVRTSFFITFLSLMVLAAVAKPFVLILVGQKWEASILYLQLLAIVSVFFPLNILNSNIIKIKGRSDLILKLQIIKVFLIIPTIIMGIYYGIVVMLLVSIITSFIATYINSIYSGSLINYKFKEQISDIAPYFFPILFIAGCMFVISLMDLSKWMLISIQLTIGCILFFAIFERMNYSEYKEIKQLIIELIKKPNQ